MTEKIKEYVLSLPPRLSKMLRTQADTINKLTASDHAELVLCLAFVEAENAQLVDSTAALGLDFGVLAHLDYILAFLRAHQQSYERAKEILATIGIDLDKFIERPKRFTETEEKLSELEEARQQVIAGVWKGRDTTAFVAKQVPAGVAGAVVIGPDGAKVMSASELPELLASLAAQVAGGGMKCEPVTNDGFDASSAFNMRPGTKH